MIIMEGIPTVGTKPRTKELAQKNPDMFAITRELIAQRREKN